MSPGIQEVYQGRSDTGSAFVLNTPQGDVLGDLKEKAATLKAEKAAEQKGIADAEAAKEKAYGDLTWQAEVPYKNHIPYFQERENNVKKAMANLKAQGKNPQDLSDPSVMEFHKMKDAYLTEAKASSNQISFIQDTNKMLLEHKDDFAPEAIAEWNKYTQLPWEEMAQTPIPDLQPNVNEDLYGQRILKDHLTANTDAYAYMGSDGIMYSGTTAITGERQKQEASIPYWNKANPYLQRKIDKEIEGLPVGELESMTDEMRKLNEERATYAKKGEPAPKPLTFQEYYVYKTRMAGLEKTTEKKGVSGNAKSAFGWKSKQEAATWLVDQIEGWQEGNFSDFEDIVDPGMKPGMDAIFQESDVMSPLNFGDGNAYKLIRNKTTNELAIATDEGIDPRSIPKEKWFPQSAAFSKLAPAIASSNSDFDFGLITAEAKKREEARGRKGLAQGNYYGNTKSEPVFEEGEFD